MDQCPGAGKYCKHRHNQFIYQYQPRDKDQACAPSDSCKHPLLLHRAYAEYKSEEMGVLSLEQWCELRAQQSVHFQYWFTGWKLLHWKLKYCCMLWRHLSTVLIIFDKDSTLDVCTGSYTLLLVVANTHSGYDLAFSKSSRNLWWILCRKVCCP